MDADNLKYWNELCRAPKEALKQFQRPGGFKGTAIKPMWSIKRMTEVFGPVGDGWKINHPSFQVVEAGDEILVFCTVSIELMGDEEFRYGQFYGVGGDKVRVVNNKGEVRNDDEAFKKAYTDALTNALKLLGVGADVHMGLWDGSKYVDDASEAPQEPQKPPQKYDRSPIVRGEFDRLLKSIYQIEEMGTLEDLSFFWKQNQETIKNLPADWKAELEAKKDVAKTNLTEKAAA